MASFQVKIGRKSTRKRENKNYYYISFIPDAKLKIPRKQQKNSKNSRKSKYTIMPLFQAKIGCKMPRKREFENYRSVSFQPDAKQKIPKKQQKNSKIKKIPLCLHYKPKQVGNG